MIFYLHFLLVNKQYQNFNLKLLVSKFDVVALIIWCVLPLLNFIGYWDNFLSFSLFSGKLPLMEISIKGKLPTALNKYFLPKKLSQNTDTTYVAHIQTWGMQGILVPPYPEVRVYKKIKEELLKKYSAVNIRFNVYKLPKKSQNIIELK